MAYGKRYKSGVYYITSFYNDKIYIGSSKSINSRIKIHARLLRNDIHPNKRMQEDYNICSKGFEWGILEYTDDYKVRERYYINLLDATNPAFGYNSNQ